MSRPAFEWLRAQLCVSRAVTTVQNLLDDIEQERLRLEQERLRKLQWIAPRNVARRKTQLTELQQLSAHDAPKLRQTDKIPIDIDEIPTKILPKRPSTEPRLPTVPITQAVRVITVPSREEKFQADIMRVVGEFSQEIRSIRRVALSEEDYTFLLDAVASQRLPQAWREGYPVVGGQHIPWYVDSTSSTGEFYCM